MGTVRNVLRKETSNIIASAIISTTALKVARWTIKFSILSLVS